MLYIRSPDQEKNGRELQLRADALGKRKEEKMEKMKFDDFAKAIVEKIREYLPETFAQASVELQTVTKNNDLRLTGLTIRGGESDVCPTIYLEQFFDAYQSGEEIGEILRNIADLRIRNEVAEKLDISQIMEFENAKDSIIPRLSNKDWNQAYLTERPFMEIADLAVTYHICIGKTSLKGASTPVTNALMNQWGIGVKELHEIAIRNMDRLFPSTLRPMSAVLSALVGEAAEAEPDLADLDPHDEPMFVLSNRKGLHGAAALLDKKIMGAILEKFGKEFYILPSSVHEVLIVPETPDMEVAMLASMVKSINHDQVEPQERLSDHVYRYSAEEGLVLA